jgi:hypothetical protein
VVGGDATRVALRSRFPPSSARTRLQLMPPFTPNFLFRVRRRPGRPHFVLPPAAITRFALARSLLGGGSLARGVCCCPHDLRGPDYGRTIKRFRGCSSNLTLLSLCRPPLQDWWHELPRDSNPIVRGAIQLLRSIHEIG